MKIIFFVGEFSEGGAERVISILANSLVEKGFDIEILKYYNSINFYQTNEKIKITSIEENTHTTSKLTNSKWLKNYAKKNCVLFISFLAPFNMFAIYSLLGTHIPLIVADRNDPYKMPKKAILRSLRNYLYKYANAVVLQTEHNKNYFSKQIQSKSIVISNPLQMDKENGIALITKKENLIVSVGRLEEQKNQKMLIKAFNDIKDNYDDLKLVIYGEGPYRKDLQAYIKELGIENDVTLPGNEKDIFNKISKAKLFAITSNYEGMSNAMIEAMCLGLPVISTKVSGAEELIQDGTNGYTIDIGDSIQLQEKIDAILSDDTLAKELGENASNIYNKLKTDVIVDKWIELINKVK